MLTARKVYRQKFHRMQLLATKLNCSAGAVCELIVCYMSLSTQMIMDILFCLWRLKISVLLSVPVSGSSVGRGSNVFPLKITILDIYA